MPQVKPDARASTLGGTMHASGVSRRSTAPDSSIAPLVTSSKLRESVADGPILFRGFENVHEHVVRPDAGAFGKQLRDPPEQRLLLFRGAVVEHCDLDVHDIGAPGDAVGIAVAEV